MLPQSLLLLVVAITPTLAAPTILKRDINNLSLPSSSLASPSSISPPLGLKQVTLGIGHQNYTCNADGTMTNTGATAALYDISSLLTFNNWLTAPLPGFVLTASGLHNDTVSSTADKSEDEEDFDRDLSYGSLTAKQLGIHFFNAAGSPTFDLYETSPPSQLVGKKLGDVSAPAGACPGPDNAGAVDWLQLGDNGANLSFGGLSYVYRVETAGGKSPATCDKSKAGTVLRVPYAAEYWFYGPK